MAGYGAAFYLPSSYKHYRDSLMRGSETISIEKVKSTLLSKKWQKLSSSNHLRVAKVLMIRARKLERGSSSRR